MSTFELIRIIAAAVIATILITYYGIKAIKNGWLKKIKDTILLACREAEEKWPNGHGAEKKAYVLQKVEDACRTYGIPYGLIKALILKVIEQVIGNYNNFIK